MVIYQPYQRRVYIDSNDLRDLMPEKSLTVYTSTLYVRKPYILRQSGDILVTDERTDGTTNAGHIIGPFSLVCRGTNNPIMTERGQLLD